MAHHRCSNILLIARLLISIPVLGMPVLGFAQTAPTLPPPSVVTGPLFRSPDGGIAKRPAGERAVITVGPGQVYKIPSEAAAVAQDGDRVEIRPGRYVDCAIWKAKNLTIEGTAPGVVIANKSCAGKGIFVLEGDNTTVRNLTLTGASVPDENGAGIRLEKGNLFVVGVKFIGNQNGILGGNPGAKVTVLNSDFEGNEFCGGACAHGMYINAVDILHVEHSRFFNTRQGHSIKSRALRTEVTDCNIADGPDGTSSYLIDAPNGGVVVIRNNTLEKGPHSENRKAAIAIGEEGVTHPTPEILITNNNFQNDGDFQTTLVWNTTAAQAVLSGNKLSGQAIPLRGEGSVAQP
jgi:Right handed beta helix region